LIITTIGLVVHSLSDGFALGSATYSDITNESSLTIIIFVALMLHKGPAAIGLTTFLMHEGLKRKQIILHLLAFTLSSPVSALLTFYGFNLLSDRSNAGSPQTMKLVGFFLLISAGTFLYVAMIHILPEVYCNSDSH